MMKSVVLGVVLLNFILLLACTRVQVEILQPTGKTETHSPRGGHEVSPDELKSGPLDEEKGLLERKGGQKGALRSDFILLTQFTGNACATDRNVTTPVAQETGVWCWAASAQGVMSFHNVNPRQCAIVNKVKAGNAKTAGSQPKPFCCENKFEAQCQQNGYPDEVFDSFEFDYGYLRGTSLSQEDVARQICGNGPFTYAIEYEGGGGHTFVVKDYQSFFGEEMSLWVDQHESYTDTDGNLLPKGFRILSYKEYAEGFYDGTFNRVEFTYVKIKPLRIE